ncbi:hypothetical protein SDC9_192188 [bioreactor metagenome]|uniref:Uncharacterized protein n=1 Tax=bioreactor metagenome TaxID=1076179 RepID=A0A645IB27_9ZZZZ
MFADHQPLIPHAILPLHNLNILGLGVRGDPIDHGQGESNLLFNPRYDGWKNLGAVLEDAPFQHMPVGGYVVTGGDGELLPVLLATLKQGERKESYRRMWILRI